MMRARTRGFRLILRPVRKPRDWMVEQKGVAQWLVAHAKQGMPSDRWIDQFRDWLADLAFA